jgi:hypothetical protein
LTVGLGPFDAGNEIARQRELFRNAFPEHDGTHLASVEHYRWKFHGFPNARPSYEYAATENGRMLGYYAAIPYPYEIGGSRISVGMVCDVMTHSDARGRGVFTELGRFALAEMESSELALVTGYPIRPEVMGGHLRAGWSVAFELPMYLRPLRANAILRSKRLPFLAPPVNFGISAYQAMLAPRPNPGDYTGKVGVPGELFDTAEFAVFLQAWSGSVPNHLVKSRDFYAWRLGAPETTYQASLVYRDDAVVAAAIGRQAVLNGIPSFALLDLMVLEGHERALPTLYRTIDTVARQHRVEAIVTMMSRHSASRYRLLRYGFLKSPFTFKLILRSVSDAVTVSAISREADWHLMWIDSDDL